MTDKQQLEILEMIDSIPTPPPMGMAIVDKGLVEVRKEVRECFKKLDIILNEKEPLEKIETLTEKYYAKNTVIMLSIFD